MSEVAGSIGPTSSDTPDHALWKLAAIGTLAGVFSGLFGVGGGTIIVPLLIFWFGYGERLATGTSLAAIVIIGLLGALAQGGIYGNVHLATGLLLAIPAVVGVILGTAIQQRIPQRAVSYLFALLLVAIAVELILS
ncbi:MAG TPA: sulfite exporter TauE/SafE family protein [Solirubrobacterales bacterium]|nr:sulfite exporter TauE/SafE family protein [Solirubrobacterales bacterium]